MSVNNWISCDPGWRQKVQSATFVMDINNVANGLAATKLPLAMSSDCHDCHEYSAILLPINPFPHTFICIN